MELRAIIAAVHLAMLLACGSALAAEPPQAIDFNRDVRPILADHCYQCHGPDSQQRQGDLRLDTSDGATPNREGGPVVVAGRPEQSELWRRITSSDVAERMPPPEKGGNLTPAQIATLKQWILEGAKFERHWSLLPVRRPLLPDLSRPANAANAIDTFVLARLEKENIAPSPTADRSTLLRRVTLALTGLPPTADQIEAFLNSTAPDAYERAVDRLLASPCYGERMAVPWLDAARYADTSGYQSDGERFMWRWRDWVIEALNANLPFDQFTIEQLAGDLLPQATLDQRIATGFNRNHRGNAEGGIIPEEYAVEYVADRVETTSTVWLGLTLGCARCHDHKYDPFTQRDFYSLFAFFNNVPEHGRAIKIGNSPPFIKAPTRLQQEERRRLEIRFADAFANAQHSELRNSPFENWLLKSQGTQLGDWSPNEKITVHLSFDANAEKTTTPDQLAHEGNLAFCAGRINRAAEFDGKTSLALDKVGDFGFFDKFTLAAWIKSDAGNGTIISRMTDLPQGEGYQLAVVAGKLHLSLAKRWLDDALRVETVEPVAAGEWHHVAATYDGSRLAAGVTLYIDGRRQPVNVLLDELNQTFATKEPLRIGGGGGPEGKFRGAIDEVRVYEAALSPADIAALATPETLDQIIAMPQKTWSGGRHHKLYEYYLWHHAPPEAQAAARKERETSRALEDFEEKLPTVMVMQEMSAPRQAHLLLRGQYDKPGERVTPNVPAELPPLPVNTQRNRLDLANWLVAPENPLTARVFVNRLWQLHFGTGIVKTAEDFGRQGEWPSHPELLAWLAADFMHDWDVKRLHRAIVTSATFRQTSAVTKTADPDNRLLSRGPRLRLSAEMVRDQALFTSGLLLEQLGGPSVRPAQPAGLWSELTGGDDYQPGGGADQVRRSLYTFWKRTIPPPSLSTFDASSREACVVRESRTNTPLQALVLLNEPTYVAAAQSLAQRVMREVATPEQRIARAMLHALNRSPTAAESKILLAALQRYRHASPQNDELSAYALICGTILNLDEAVTSQ